MTISLILLVLMIILITMSALCTPIRREIAAIAIQLTRPDSQFSLTGTSQTNLLNGFLLLITVVSFQMMQFQQFMRHYQLMTHQPSLFLTKVDLYHPHRGQYLPVHSVINITLR
jgi:hypothetical protein